MAKGDLTQDLLPLSKLSPGTLNELIRDEVYESFSIPDDNFMDLFMKVARKTLGPNYKLVNRTFQGVCLRVLDNEESQRLISNNTNYKKLVEQSGAQKVKACQVFIPEIHSERCLPNDIYDPDEKDLEIMKAFFPVFVSKTEAAAALPMNEGDIVEVEIKNELGGGVYIQRINETSSVTIFKRMGGSNTSFKCSILRFARIENQKGRTVTAGTTIGGETKSSSVLNEATLKQQYIKYLYTKERFFNRKLNDFWFDRAFKQAVVSSKNIIGGASLSSELIWVILYKLCGYNSTGLANKGNVAMHVESLNDGYGIFKTTKVQYDQFVEKNKTVSLPTDIKNQFSLGDHSDLLDPEFAIKFFIIDFRRYLTKNNIDPSALTPSNLSGDQKKKITNYFTANDKRVDYFFGEPDLTKLANTYSATNNMPKSIYDSSIPKIYGEFPTFQEWLSAALGGVSLNVLPSLDKTNVGSVKNSPNLEQKNPKSVSDKCHNNYPPKNSYLLHVDSQKKAIKEFMSSLIAGNELEYSSNSHVGKNSIKMSGAEIKSDFKVLRFDGTMLGAKDPVRWFDAKNSKNLIFKSGYNLKAYRPIHQITHFMVHSLNATNDHNRFYKDTLSFLYGKNKPVPHFLISPSGQIIQLVDAAAAINFDLPNKEFSVSAAFVEGPGSIMPIISDNSNVSIKNHILVKNNKDKNIYSPHKIGSKAALQAMQKLIQFFIANTSIKYNLAAQDFKLLAEEINKSSIQAFGHYKGIGGMNFIYYAWAYGLAYRNNGQNILSTEEGYA